VMLLLLLLLLIQTTFGFCFIGQFFPSKLRVVRTFGDCWSRVSTRLSPNQHCQSTEGIKVFFKL